MSAPRGLLAAIFDMDGVLIDSEPHHHVAWHRLCLEEGVILTPAQVAARTLGRPIRESLPVLLGRPVGVDEAARLIQRKAALYEEASGGTVPPVAGVVAFVRGLGDLGVARGLATSALTVRVEPALAAIGLDDQFTVRVTGDDVRQGKPDPEVYLTAAARLGVPPRACVVFEDAPVGIDAGRRAGMMVVGVATTCTVEDLRTAGAHRVIADFTRLTWEEAAPGA